MSFISQYQQMNQHDPFNSLREEVRSILRDYRNFWDVYAELIQNSVDAINRRYRIVNDPSYYLYEDFHSNYPDYNELNYQGKIELRIDTRTNAITVSDNGVGIKQDNLLKILLPKFSEKKIKCDYGFKGYGLTFVTFISRNFSVSSRYFAGPECFSYNVNDVFDWISLEGTQFPSFPDNPEIIRNEDMDNWNTKVTVRLDDDYQRKFDAVAALDRCKELLSSKDDIKKFEYILRTKTAVGNTKGLFSLPPVVPIDIKLIVILPDGTIEEKEIPYSYYHPIEHSEISVNAYEFDNYVTQMNSANFNRGFRGMSHAIKAYSIGSRTPISCDILLSAISSTRLGNIERELGLDEIDDPASKISCGIYLSIDGMPTGIRLDSWDKKGGTYKRYYVVVDCKMDISNTLDSGRKGITSHYANLIDESVIKLINTTKSGVSDTFGSYASKDLDIGRGTPPGGGGLVVPDFLTDINTSKVKIISDEAQFSGIVNKIKKYSCLKGLPHSEQEVVILFYSLLSKGYIKGYNVIYQAGAEKVYDAGFEYRLELEDDNVEPNDPIGFGRLTAQQLISTGILDYNHANHYAYKTVYPEICVEFKLNVGGLLYELRGQTNKEPSQIDILIVWDTTIPPQVPSNSYTLTNINDKQRIYHGSTHRLGILGERNTEITVISLKDILGLLP